MQLIRRAFLNSVLATFLPFYAFAAEDGLIEAISGHNLNQSEFLQRNSILVGGWIAAGFSYSTDNPDHRDNGPVTFNDRNGELQLNQLNFYAQKLVDMESDNIEFGGRIDLLYGTDARFTQATGLDDNLISEADYRFYDLALPQIYLEVFSPVGNGLSAKIGHFYTIIGYEVVNAPDNFFYSHAYTMQYGEPFSHTGILFNYPLNGNISINIGSVNGWDNFSEDLSNWNFIGNISWSNDDESTSLVLSMITGDIDAASNENRTLYSLVATHHFTDELHYLLQHDFGFQEQAAMSGNDAYWYGLNQYLFYDYSDTLSFGLRAEWFRDDGASRLTAGSSASYFAVSTGINWEPRNWIKIRPEIRYDWADGDTHAFDNQTRNDQLLFSMDIVLTL
ncbi:porin [Methylomarinum vadi]|uniref:porin n=1 Tax=Methylomarinum vadi TaxID=438855 RepID=UPI0004DF5A6F|nr:porin [Methylomarinum vadi]